MRNFEFGYLPLFAMTIGVGIMAASANANDQEYKLDARFSYCDEASTNSEAIPIVGQLVLPEAYHKRAQITICFDVPKNGGFPANIRVPRNEAPDLLDAALSSVMQFRYGPWISAGNPTQRDTLKVTFSYGPDPADYDPEYNIRIAQRTHCKNTDKILTIPTKCICKVGAYDRVPFFRDRFELIDGYVGYSSIETVDSMKGIILSNKNFARITLTGTCNTPEICRNGEPVAGPISACLVAAYWDEYAAEERINRRFGAKEGPTLFLQNLPTEK